MVVNYLNLVFHIEVKTNLSLKFWISFFSLSKTRNCVLGTRVPDYTNVIKPFEIILNSKDSTEKLQTKDTETRKSKARISHRSCSVKRGVLKNFENFTWKYLCWSLFLIKLQTFKPATLLKRDSISDVFLWNFRSS